MFDATQLGQLTARWTPDNQLVLTTPKWQHICTADEVVSLLEMLYQHRDAIFEEAHKRDAGQEPHTTQYEEQKPRSHVLSDPTEPDGTQRDSERGSTSN